MSALRQFGGLVTRFRPTMATPGEVPCLGRGATSSAVKTGSGD